MALNSLDQLRIMKGEVSPSAASLDELTHQTAAIFAVDFQTNYNTDALLGSIVNAEFVYTNPEAAAYVNKLINAGQRALKPNNNEIVNLSRVLIVILGGMSTTITQVQNATDTQWATFLSNNIQEALEIGANVRQEEKTAYNLL